MHFKVHVWNAGLAIATVALLGCQSTGLRLLSLIGVENRPVSVVLVVDKPAAATEAVNPFASYAALQRALSDHLNRPVAVDVCLQFQVDAGFTTQWYDLAVLTPPQFARLKNNEQLRVLAVTVDEQGRAGRSGLLVVRQDSPLRTIGDLKGKTVAFGPLGDVWTHEAALRLLEDGGIRPADLSLDLLPVPGSLRHLGDSRSIAESVVAGSSDAGFVDEAAWDALPEDNPVDSVAARDKLRIIARTAPLPYRLLVAAPHLDPQLARQIQAFAEVVGTDRPETVEPLASMGFTVPTPEQVQACRQSAPGQPAEPPAQSASAP